MPQVVGVKAGADRVFDSFPLFSRTIKCMEQKSSDSLSEADSM